MQFQPAKVVFFFYKTSCDTKPLAFHQSSLCSSTVGLSLWLENLRSSRSCTSQDFKHLLWIPTRTWTGSLTFLFFFLFIASQWRHLKCSHMCSTDIQKHLCLFFFFFQTELNVLPVICLIYCLFNIAKMLQGVKGEVAPRRVARSKHVHRSYYQPWGLRLYIEEQAVWMWAGLPHWARMHTDMWLCDFMAEHMRWRQSERATL